VSPKTVASFQVAAATAEIVTGQAGAVTDQTGKLLNTRLMSSLILIQATTFSYRITAFAIPRQRIRLFPLT